MLCSASANDAGAALPFETSRAPSEGINAEDTAALETAVPTGAGPVITQEPKTKRGGILLETAVPKQPKLRDHRPSGANLHAAKIQDDLDRKIKELRDAAFQEQTTLLLNAPNACIVASGLRWEKHPVRGWSHGPREQEQPDADSKPSSDLGPCSASPLATTACFL